MDFNLLLNSIQNLSIFEQISITMIICLIIAFVTYKILESCEEDDEKISIFNFLIFR